MHSGFWCSKYGHPLVVKQVSVVLARRQVKFTLHENDLQLLSGCFVSDIPV